MQAPPRQQLEHLSARLAALAREEAVLRLHLGQALEVIGRSAVFDLGFSSLAAYALERCERSARWAEGARCLARRLELLPVLRAGLVSGQISWSMAELIARVAQPHDEPRWIAEAEGKTVRQMRMLVAKATSSAVSSTGPSDAEQIASSAASQQETTSTASSSVVATGDDETRWVDSYSEGDDLCTLTCTVDREDAWLFEATRALLECLGVHGAEARSEALLAEAQETLLRSMPGQALELRPWQSSHAAQQSCSEGCPECWLAELGRSREEAEEHSEGNVLRLGLAERAQCESSRATPTGWAMAAAQGISPLEHASSSQLDQLVRTLHETLARHELELSLRVLEFHRADGWRRLGYATETQYARERLGMSRSAFAARRWLALRLEKLPDVAAALGSSQIGVEAAMQLVRVATANTQAAWVERARSRTIKHLKEEVAAALTAIRWSGETDCPPPDDSEIEAFHRLERAVVSGGGHCAREPVEEAPVNAHRSPASGRRPWRVMLSSLGSWLATGELQTSAAATRPAGTQASASAGRVTLRLRMSRATRAWWRELEALAASWLPPTLSWVRFLCSSLWRAWRHLFDSDVAYAHIYARDRHRCMSPVCNRRDVTPHHLKFRSAGGGDEDENVVSICSWCHLHGVHGGRIRATGTAALIHWELGAPKSPCLVVHGRERAAA